ncbi:aldose 1-epimerase family protein [Roseiarcaceae bacterium H3SJ34-1]|uniref:aldose 1-epimerase family protein n=1 Tax=Terripilifer ovatus TaxID=3032367 RepID=UPI003AB98FE4|nr:aldose 1-epimerase family protein [Roseiarcaceae bacterium H3SJ34-1]
MSAQPAVVHLRAGAARASIAAAGAELTGWRAGGRDLIWQPDPAYWNASSPVLFPIVGWARDGKIRVGGHSYPMGVHGFAAESQFDVEQSAPNKARFILTDAAASHAIYPFKFRLVLDYTLSETALRIDILVSNEGDAVMPYACGLHPGFRWPFASGEQGDYAIVFAEPEDPDVPVIAPGGLFGKERRRTSLDGRRLTLSSSLFMQEAMCFLDARSRSLRFEGLDGMAIRIAAEGFPHFALWSRPRAPFLCVETWSGHGDPQGFDGDLYDKPSMIHLQPQQERRHCATFELVGPSISG